MNVSLKKFGIILLIAGMGLITWQVIKTTMESTEAQMINKSRAIKQNPVTSSSLNPHFPASIASYETIWAKGRSLDECMGPEKMMDENTVKCRSGYYEKVPVYK